MTYKYRHLDAFLRLNRLEQLRVVLSGYWFESNRRRKRLEG